MLPIVAAPKYRGEVEAETGRRIRVRGLDYGSGIATTRFRTAPPWNKLISSGAVEGLNDNWN
jgi:hypothetical protein